MIRFALIVVVCIICWMIGTERAGASVHSRITPIMRSDTTCQDRILIDGKEYAGRFWSTVPSAVWLHDWQVCRPMRRLWSVGFPNRYNTATDRVRERRLELAYATFVAAHEEQHVEQWEAGNFVTLVPTNSDYTWIEADADCGAAQEFRPWARDIGVTTYRQRQLLQRVLREDMPDIGYDNGAYTVGCWQ